MSNPSWAIFHAYKQLPEERLSFVARADEDALERRIGSPIVTARPNTVEVTSSRSAEFISHTDLQLSRAVTFQFALDPNSPQLVLMIKCAGARRFTMNHHLARIKANLEARSSVLEGDGESLAAPFSSTMSWSGFSFVNEGDAWKNGLSDDAPVNEDGSKGLLWRHELPCDVFECASIDAALALESFVASMRGKRSGPPVGFPRFQARGRSAQSFRLRNGTTKGQMPSQQRIRFTDPSHLRLPKLGSVKVFGPTRKVRRMIAAGRFHIYSATLSERAGRWIVSLNGVAAEFHQAERSRATRHEVPVGVDRGVRSLCVAADANGTPFETFEGVKLLREAEHTLKMANQTLARTTPGSKGHQRAKARLARAHRKIANTRRHLVHEASKTLVSRAQVLVIEDLNIVGLAKNRRMTRAIMDSATGELSRQILYKAHWYGVEVRIADRFYPSSKMCSACGKVKDDLNLSERTYLCSDCGLIIDRDLNAAINLARWCPKESLTPADSPLVSIV